MQSITASDQTASTASTAVAVGSSARLPEPLTSFIGREQEIAKLLALLSRPETRLLTLTGPGGAGKTRLAITLAKAIALDTTTAVAFIPLASIGDPALVAPTIGATFGLNDRGDQFLAERLSAILNDKPFLLVLDNFEHLVDAAPITSLLLSYCPTLKILTTSRRSLHVSGEVEYLVPPLDTPCLEDSRERIEQSASYRLFAERSAGVVGGASRVPHHHDTEAVGKICSRLDGLPLAIELAAARTRVMSPSELLARLDQRLPLLTGGPLDAPVRLQTMRDAIAWSYDLLNADEKRLLRTLAVFSGGFTVEAVEAVAPGSLETPALDLLSRLIDHNLVRRMPATEGPTRFTMLETIREFALDELRAHNEETSARDRHLSWLITQLGSPEPEEWDQLRGKIQLVLPEEHDNLRSAMAWALQGEDVQRATQIAWGLLPFWSQSELFAEGHDSLQRIVERGQTLDPILHAGILCRISEFAQILGNHGRDYSAASEAVIICRDIDYAIGIRAGLHCMGRNAMWSDPSAAVDLISQAAEISRSFAESHRFAMDLCRRAEALICLGEPQRALVDASEALAIFRAFQGPEEAMKHDHILALLTAGWASGMLGRIEQAHDYASQSLLLSRQLDIRMLLNWSNRTLGEVELMRGNYRHAFEHFRESLLSARRQGAMGFETFTLIQFGMLNQAAGNWTRAARLFGFIETSWTRLRFAESTMRYATWRFDVSPTRLALGEDLFAEQFEAGRRLTSAEAVDEALSFSVADQTPEVRSSILTRRESEVLVHLSQGKTNQEIAADLFLGKSTIDTHVSHILAKLGVDSRRAAVKVARERGLLPH